MNPRTRCACAALCLSLSTALASATPVPWPVAQGGNGHSYDYVPGNRPWTQARADASQVTYLGTSGYLATITSAAESQFVEQHFAPAQAWIGGYQDQSAPDYAEPGGGWRWVTGEPWNYTRWATHVGFPDNFGGDQHYLKYAGGPWWDDLQNSPGGGFTGIDGFLVEFNVVPEPASPALAAAAGALALLRRRRRRTRVR